MKETGVIRRLDELGRIVIPKEIRKNLRINEGDMIEIYVEALNTIALRKHSPFKINEEDGFNISKTLYEKYKNTIIITNKEQVIGGYGEDYSNYVDRFLSDKYQKTMNEALPYYGPLSEIVTRQTNQYVIMIQPLKNKEEYFGSIAMIEDKSKIDSGCEQMMEFTASFFAKKLES